MKACSRCGNLKPLDEFHHDSLEKDGHTNRCKACVAELGAVRYAANADRTKAQRKTYRETHKAEILAAHKAYRETHKAEMLAANKAYRQANFCKVKKSTADWRRANPEKAKTTRRKYLQDNREKVNACRRRNVDNISAWYAAKTMGMPVAEVTPALLELKREQLTLRRLARQLKKAADESSKDSG